MMPLEPEDKQIIERLAAEVRVALAYLRAGQGYGTITVQLVVRDGMVALVEVGPVRSIKPE